MEEERMSKPKPLTVNDLAAGKDCVFVSVDFFHGDGAIMELRKLTFLSEPYQKVGIDSIPHIDFLFQSGESCDPLPDCAYVTSLGLVDEFWPLACSRVFEYTDSAYETLSRLVQEKDLVGYLQLIDFPDPEKTIANYRAINAEVEEMLLGQATLSGE